MLLKKGWEVHYRLQDSAWNRLRALVLHVCAMWYLAYGWGVYGARIPGP